MRAIRLNGAARVPAAVALRRAASEVCKIDSASRTKRSLEPCCSTKTGAGLLVSLQPLALIALLNRSLGLSTLAEEYKGRQGGIAQRDRCGGLACLVQFCQASCTAARGYPGAPSSQNVCLVRVFDLETARRATGNEKLAQAAWPHLGTRNPPRARVPGAHRISKTATVREYLSGHER